MNKYINAFRESYEKLEEDIGNPSVTEVIGYDIDNAEICEDKEAQQICKNLNDIWIQMHKLYEEYPDNKKLIKVLNSLSQATYDMEHLLANEKDLDMELSAQGDQDTYIINGYKTFHDLVNSDM